MLSLVQKYVLSTVLQSNMWTCLSHKHVRQYIHSNGMTPNITNTRRSLLQRHEQMALFRLHVFVMEWSVSMFSIHSAKNQQSLYWSHGSVDHKEEGKRIFLFLPLHSSPGLSQRLTLANDVAWLSLPNFLVFRLAVKLEGNVGGRCGRGQSKAVLSVASA
jgi:hypothetical protein